jgi:hypothetical protein
MWSGRDSNARPDPEVAVMPFPTTLPTLLTADASMEVALTTALADTQLSFPSSTLFSRLALSIVAIDEPPLPLAFRHAGIRDRETHYSASLLKVAAMLAAFQLRQSANNFAASVAEPTPAALFAHMSATFDPLIAAAVPLITSDPNVQPSMRVPKYQSVFVAIPLITGGFSIAFNGSFLTDMRAMMVDSSNVAAAQCIQRLGYSWINGVLASGGLFNATTNQGIWLAGTFTATWPYVRITSVNDGPVAQATTTFDTANLFALLVQKLAIDSSGQDAICDEMLGLLADTASGPEPAWLQAGARPGFTGLSTDFIFTHAKIGLGPLKPQNGGFDVASEATIIKHGPTGRRFIVVWQNTKFESVSLNALAHLVDRTMKNFLGLP